MSTALLVGSTACSGSDKKADASETPAGQSSDKPSDPPLADLTATQVVAGLSGAGYKCSTDGTYAICTTGTASVWVLTGAHKRPPVVSLHASGPVAAATAEIATKLPQVLEVAHVNPRTEITEWFGQLGDKPTGQLTAGDWQVDWSTEVVDTDEPGAHLTLVDKLCTVNCQAE
ncbi:hypothetical protein [Kribbella catacumbae]|uniref:hypothetical protein n=1 Tax=Kribbella catacumbae TaxID=460086 RepID=UPI0003661138|nr:hypothetical protein [Kribbella catacumbae]